MQNRYMNRMFDIISIVRIIILNIIVADYCLITLIIEKNNNFWKCLLTLIASNYKNILIKFEKL